MYLFFFQILIYVLLLSAAGSSSSVVSALQSKFFTLFHQRARRQFQGDQTRADLAIMDHFRRRIVVENKELSQLVAEHILHQSAGDQI